MALHGISSTRFRCRCLALMLLASVAWSEVVTISTNLLQVNVTVSPSGTCLQSFTFSLELAGDPAPAAWTPSLLANGAVCGNESSTTGLTISTLPTTLTTATGGTVSASNATAVKISGIAIGDIATEEWQLSVDASSLWWSVTRSYVASGNATTDQFPALWMTTTTGAYDVDTEPRSRVPPRAQRGGVGDPTDWRSQQQMPSFLSTDAALLNTSAGMGWLTAGGKYAAVLGDSSSGDSRRIMLAPSGVAAQMTLSDCRFSYTRGMGWIVQTVGIGAECAAGPQGGYAFTAGDVRTLAMRLDLSPSSQGLGYFDLSVPAGSPAADVVSNATVFANVYAMMLGWVNGNSPASCTCIHEASLFAQLPGMYRIAPPPVSSPQRASRLPVIDLEPSAAAHAAAMASTSLQNATMLQMDFMLNVSVLENGFVFSRWSVNGGNIGADKGIIDQMPHMVLLAYYYAISTGDKVAVQRWMPKLDSIATYMLDVMLVNATGVLTDTNPACDGRANAGCADNWLDDVRFGWQDGIVAVYAVEAFRALGDMKLWTGDASGANASYALHARMVGAYNAAFWDDGASLYHDWVDAAGIARTYAYVWQQYAAIEFGVATPAQSVRIMNQVQALYASVQAQFNVTPDVMWCAPTNLIPLSPADLTVNFDREYVYPNYENGDCFYWHTGLELVALGRVLGPAAAYDRFAVALQHFSATRFWGQRYGWLEQQVLGFDVITDGGFLLYGGLMGALNIRLTLLEGVQVLGPAAPALEGANFTLAVGGVDVLLNVHAGTVRVLPLL